MIDFKKAVDRARRLFRPLKSGTVNNIVAQNRTTLSESPACIYCGDDAEPRTEEHIIPLALDGPYVIPKASCPRCQRIINEEIENKILNPYTGMFGPLRLRLSLRSRTASRKRGRCATHPASLTLTAVRQDGKRRKLSIPYKDIPTFIPGILTNNDPPILTGKPLGEIQHWRRWRTDEAAKYAAPTEILEGFCVTDHILPARFIAKIAHGFAVAEYGCDFEPFLPPVILGKEPNPYHYIGSHVRPKEDQPFDGYLHKIRVERNWKQNKIIVKVRLFSAFEGLEYTVVVGKPYWTTLIRPWRRSGRVRKAKITTR